MTVARVSAPGAWCSIRHENSDGEIERAEYIKGAVRAPEPFPDAAASAETGALLFGAVNNTWTSQDATAARSYRTSVKGCAFKRWGLQNHENEVRSEIIFRYVAGIHAKKK